MQKTHGKQRVLSFLLAVAMVCSMLSTSLLSAFAVGTPELSNISISGDTGYYVKDGSLYSYNVQTERSSAVEKMAGLDADYVLYDGTTLYTAGTNTVVTAFNTADWSQKWKFDKQDRFQFNPPMAGAAWCQPNAEMVLKDGSLYLYTYAMGGTFIQQAKAAVVILKAADGSEKAPVSLAEVKNSNGSAKSLAFEMDGSIVFTGSTFATVNTETSEVTYQAGLFDGGAVYESAMEAVVGLSGGTIQYTAYPLTDSSEKRNMNLTPAGSTPVIVNADDVPVVFSIKDGKAVYDIFTGLELVTKTTNVEAESLSGLTVSGHNAYVLNKNGEIARIAVDFTDVPTHQAPAEEAKKLDERIMAVVNSLPIFNGAPDLSQMSLEYEKEIKAIYTAYITMDEAEQKGVFEAEWLNKLKDQTDELCANLDKLNDTIKELPAVENLKKTDTEAVKAAQDIYNGLKEFDRTLVDKKLSVLLEKVAAFDVTDQIDALPGVEDVKTTDLAAIQAARAAYETVADKWKSEVSNIGELEALEKKLDELLQSIEAGSYWSSYGKDRNNSAVVGSKLPTSLEEMEILFYGQEEKLSANEPIIVGDRMYTARGNKLSCFDLNGNRIATVDLYTSSDFFSRLAYGDGKIFVTISGRVQAFDAETLTPLWLTPKTNLQMQSPITYNDGYIYFGGTDAGGGAGGGTTGGGYFCVSTEDEDTNDKFEVKKYTWSSETTGFYWGGGIVVSDKVYFAGDNGILTVHHLTQDIVYDTYESGGKVRSVPVYDPVTNRLMVATVDNHTLYAIELNEDGSLNKETIIKTDEIGGTTGGFSAYNGRVYLPCGGMLNSDSLVVLELNEKAGEFKFAYDIPELKSQSLPLVTTAYATAENGYKVFVYAIDFESGVAYCFEDSQKQTAYREVFKIGNVEKIGGKEHKTTTYNSGGFRADQNGNLYFIGGSSWGFPNGDSATSYALTIFGNQNAAFTAEDVENAIALLPEDISYEDKENVLAARERYDALDGAVQADVANADELTTAVAEIKRLTQERLAQVEEEIEKISDPVVMADEKTIETASRLYGSLLEDDKAQVAGRDTLKTAIAALYDLKASVAGLIEKIDQLPERDEITLKHTALINEIWNAYEALCDSDKEKVTNRQKLLDAKDKLKELNDTLLVEDFIAEINALPAPNEVTLADETKIRNLYNGYEGMHDAAKALITNAQKLKELYARVSLYRAAVDEIDNLIWNELDPMNITLKNKALVESIAEKYAALRPEEQAYVKYYSDVENAQEIIASLEKGVVPKQVFENIVGMDCHYTVEGNGYMITFHGMDITRPSDFDYGISMNPSGKADFEKLLKNGIVFGFHQNGSFPGKAVVRFNVSLQNGSCFLYQYDAENKAALKVQPVEVKDGQAIFTVDKGGVYAIAEGLAAGENGNENGGQSNDQNTGIPQTSDTGVLEPDDTDIPQTGDTGVPATAAVLLVTSLMALILLTVKKQKQSI